MFRKISNEELFSLSVEWENPIADTTLYFENVFEAWEVDCKSYHVFKEKLIRCQKHNNHYYIS